MKESISPLKFRVHFFPTMYCNAYCRHCLASAGPHQPKDFMKIEDILFYLDQFDSDPNFMGVVGFNGGEIMTAYKYHSKDYIPTIIQEYVNRNYRIDLRTNALFACDESINNIIWESLNNIDFSKYTQKIKFSLSIDQFHSNEEANAKLISRICHYDLRDTFLPTNKNPLRDYCDIDAYLIPDDCKDPKSDEIYFRLYSLLATLQDTYNIELERMDGNSIPDRFNAGIYLNKIPFLIECHPLGQWGRARENGIGNLTTEEEIQGHFNIIQQPRLLNKNHCVKPTKGILDIMFSNGTADFIVPVDKITDGVPYHNGKTCKPWTQLYPEMVAHLLTRFDELQKKYPNVTPEDVNLPYLLKTLTPRTK